MYRRHVPRDARFGVVCVAVVLFRRSSCSCNSSSTLRVWERGFLECSHYSRCCCAATLHPRLHLTACSRVVPAWPDPKAWSRETS